jgi:hypothetical protein
MVRGPEGTRRPVDIRTLPFIRFDDNEAHTQRRYGFDLGGGPGAGATGGVGGVGPDSRHPFVIRGLSIWDAHWAVSLAAPGVLVDGLGIAHCEFGNWRPWYERHAYRKLEVFHSKWMLFGERGTRPNPKVFPSPLDPVDDRPPFSVITRASPPRGGCARVEGVTVDNGTVTAVHVNGLPAKPLTSDYSRWEVEIPVPPSAKSRLTLTAAAEDAAGNREPVPHRTDLVPP